MGGRTSGGGGGEGGGGGRERTEGKWRVGMFREGREVGKWGGGGVGKGGGAKFIDAGEERRSTGGKRAGVGLGMR